MTTIVKALSAALLALTFATGAQAAPEPPAKPNVLFIIVDDLRPDFGCYGNRDVRSPNLDRLAGEGTLFLRAYCQFPLCMPSRSSVLSDYRPESIHKTGRVTGHVPAGTVTLPQLFRDHSYVTVSAGKVYHDNDDDPAGWVRRYTDTFDSEGKWCNGYCSGYQLERNRALVQNYLQGKRRQGLPASSITEITDTPDEQTPDGIIARRAVEELRKFKGSREPFFLAAGFYRPHMPLTAPKKYWDMYDRAQIKLPADFRQPDDGIPRHDWDEVRRYGDCPWKGAMPEEKAKEIVHGYHASITFVDAQIGKVLDELRRLSLEKNTVIALWSDNGWSLGEHGRFSKYTNYETSTHITLMFRVPWLPSQPPTSALVELVDIYPTLAELCHLQPPAYLEGMSVAPLLTDPRRPWKSVAFSCLHKPRERTVCNERYRLIENPNGPLELYDHQTDPAEDHNLAKDPAHAAVVKQLQDSLNAGWRAGRPSETKP